MSGGQKRLFERWRRRRARLVAELIELVCQSREQGTEEQVHRLRVTLRRLRLAVRAGRSALDGNSVGAFGRWARSVAADTSAVRDLDVVGEWLRHAGGADERLESLQRERKRIWGESRAGLKRMPGKARRCLEGGKTDKKTRRRFLRRWAHFETKVRERVRADLLKFHGLDAEARHEFRRNVRRWRYLREITLPRVRLKTDPLLQRLEAVQEATGNQQNLALVAGVLTAAGKRPVLTAARRRLRQEEEQAARAIPEAFAALSEWEDWGEPCASRSTVGPDATA